MWSQVKLLYTDFCIVLTRQGSWVVVDILSKSYKGIPYEWQDCCNAIYVTYVVKKC